MLFVLTLIVNGIARCFVVRAGALERAAARRAAPRRRQQPRRWRPTRRREHERARRNRPAGMLQRLAVSPGRRRRDRLARGSIMAATALALVPLVLIVYYLLKKGLGAWSGDFFTTDPTGNTFFKNATIGGIKSAILGTIEMVALASVIAIPIGIGVAVWLVEYGRKQRVREHRSGSSSTCSPACRRSSSACSSTSS